MSYADPGNGDSDVYVWSDGQLLHCDGCPLFGDVAYVTEATSQGQMAEHLRAHVAAGHAVPDAALARLDSEAAGVPVQTRVE
jgi:hypothetical protein